MKKHAILSSLAAAISLWGFAREPHKAVLIVQNHVPDPDVSISFLALTDELAAKLSGLDLQVINPYNSVGVNQNRDARGEILPKVSAMELARRFKAEGMITASVVEFLETPPSGAERKFKLKMILNLANAQTGEVVCGAEGADTSEKYLATQIQLHRATYINNLMSNVLDQCTKKLLSNPLLKNWKPTRLSVPLPPPPPRYPYEPLKLRDLENAINVLRGTMLEDGKFNDRYNELFAKRSGSPVLTVGGIKDLTKGKSPCAKLGEYIDHANGRLQTTLGMTHRFAIKDFAAVEELKPYIKNTDKDPLSDRSLLEALQRHVQPDLFVAGHIKYISESGLGTYYIHLGAYDFLKGVVIWENDVEVVKTLPKGGVR